jgi:AcrR family transcriptional regulator
MPRPLISDKIHQERRSRILEVAKRRFVQIGYDYTTVDDIINELNYNKSIFYSHFKTKSDILEAVVDNILSDMETAIQKFCRRDGFSAELKLNSWLQLYYDTTTTTKNIWLSYYQESNTALHHRLLKKSVDIFAPLLAEILQEGIKNKQFNEVPPLETAGAIIYLFEYFVTELNKVTNASQTERLYSALLSIMAQIVGTKFHIVRQNSEENSISVVKD